MKKKSALEIAQKCLEKVGEEKNEAKRDSLMFQFCRQMQRFCKARAEATEDNLEKQKLLSFTRKFDAMAKIYRKEKVKP